MRSLGIVAIVAVLAAGCMAQESKNSSLTATTGGSGSGSGGSGGSGSGSSGSGGTGSGTTGNPVPNSFGVVYGFDPGLSQIRGWSANSASPGTQYTVEFWVDGPRNTGELAGTQVASMFYFLPPNNNWFRFTVPAKFQDGRIRQVYVYQQDGAARNQLGSSPKGFWAGVNAAGKAYFDGTVAPNMNAGGGCLSCHQMGGSGAADYAYVKALLASPDKFTGGTATNNELINRAIGMNHGGGNRCGNINSGLCAQFQTWWGMEFN